MNDWTAMARAGAVEARRLLREVLVNRIVFRPVPRPPDMPPVKGPGSRRSAQAHKLADFRADSLEAVLERLGLAGAEVRRAAPIWAETVLRFLTHPAVSSLPMTSGILGIIVELQTRGFGVPGVVGIGSLALFFWGHWLVRLVGWEELLLVCPPRPSPGQNCRSPRCRSIFEDIELPPS